MPFKNNDVGTCLVVQWLGTHLAVQGTWVRGCWSENSDPTCRRAPKLSHHNQRARALHLDPKGPINIFKKITKKVKMVSSYHVPIGVSTLTKLTGKLSFTSEFMLDLRLLRSYFVPDPLPTHQFPKTGSCVFPAPERSCPPSWSLVCGVPAPTGD